MQSELEQMKADVIKPFPKAQELLEAETELEDVHEQLTQFELTDDSMHKQVFERLCENFMDVMTGKKLRAEYMVGDDPRKLTVELKGDVFSMSRSYMLNYEMKVDPLVCFKVDYKNVFVNPEVHKKVSKKCITFQHQLCCSGAWFVHSRIAPVKPGLCIFGDLFLRPCCAFGGFFRDRVMHFWRPF